MNFFSSQSRIRKMSHKSIFAWFSAAAFSFILIFPLERAESAYYQKIEPLFLNPLSVSSRTLTLRSDRYGKGYFGASRNGGRWHKGIDFLAPIGNPVLAAKSGRVLFSGEEKRGYGKYIQILHPDGLTTCYAHLSVLSVQSGDWVSKNQPIGNSGCSGNAKNVRIRPHLHFEVRDKAGALNPAPLMDPSIQIIQ